MQMNGEFRIPTDQETVWKTLNDSTTLKEHRRQFMRELSPVQTTSDRTNPAS